MAMQERIETQVLRFAFEIVCEISAFEVFNISVYQIVLP
jgi:hypothetical protein